MKKLLDIFGVFGASMFSSLSIVACSEKNQQSNQGRSDQAQSDQTQSSQGQSSQEQSSQEQSSQEQSSQEQSSQEQSSQEQSSQEQSSQEQSSQEQSSQEQSSQEQSSQEQSSQEQSSQEQSSQEQSSQEQSSQEQSSQGQSSQEQSETGEPSENKAERTNMSTIKSLTNSFGQPIKMYANSTKKYSDLNIQIIDAKQFENKPLINGYQIKYYTTQEGEIEITNSSQSVGSVWIDIKVADDDPNWEGRTVQRIKIDFIKIDLSTIRKLKKINGQNLVIVADKRKTFNDLTDIITNCQQFSSIPLKENYEIVYESYTNGILFKWWGTYSTIEKTVKQSIGKFYVTLTAADDDPNWEGKAERIEIELV